VVDDIDTGWKILDSQASYFSHLHHSEIAFKVRKKQQLIHINRGAN